MVTRTEFPPNLNDGKAPVLISFSRTNRGGFCKRAATSSIGQGVFVFAVHGVAYFA